MGAGLCPCFSMSSSSPADYTKPRSIEVHLQDGTKLNLQTWFDFDRATHKVNLQNILELQILLRRHVICCRPEVLQDDTLHQCPHPLSSLPADEVREPSNYLEV